MKKDISYKARMTIYLSIILLVFAAFALDSKKQNKIDQKATAEKIEGTSTKKTTNINVPENSQLEKELPKLPDPPKDDF